MKSLKILLFAAVATILAACTKDDGFSNASYESVKALEPVPVAFGTYMGDAATTRAGYQGSIALTQLQENGDGKTNGFGVFGYVTDGPYANTSNLAVTPAVVDDASAATTPGFMYNQKVSWDTSLATPNWNYSPLKYWPNDFNGIGNNVDSQPATGNATKYVSFFAYAPYVDGFTQNSADAISGAYWTPTPEVSGITALSGNAYLGNPVITYSLDSKNSVDLLWGVYNGTTENVLGNSNPGGYVMNGGNNGLDRVNINLTKQKTTGKVGFNFKHTLARVGGVGGLTIQADHASAVSADTQIGGLTRITVNSINIVGNGTAMHKSGTFDLATGVWTKTPISTEYLTFEHYVTTAADDATTANWQLNSAIAEPSTIDSDDVTTTTPASWKASNDGGRMVAGVTATPVSVYENTSDAAVHPLLFFEDDTPSFTITVDYMVRTADANLSTKFSEVQQVITKTVTFPAVQRGKKYCLAIHLGMTSVSFTASVTGWDDTPAGTPTQVDLPINVN